MPLRARAYTLAPAPIPAGAASPVGEERAFGMVPPAGAADPIGMDVHGCGVPTTALFSPVWHLALSSLWPPSVPSRLAHILTYAGTGPIRMGLAAIGTIAELCKPSKMRLPVK